MKDLIKKAVAEIVGTFVLVFCACGVAANICTDKFRLVKKSTFKCFFYIFIYKNLRMM